MISAKTGFAPCSRIAVFVANQVYAVEITSSPGPTPKTANATLSELVPLFVATAYFALNLFLIWFLNSFSLGPVLIHLDLQIYIQMIKKVKIVYGLQILLI